MIYSWGLLYSSHFSAKIYLCSVAHNLKYDEKSHRLHDQSTVKSSANCKIRGHLDPSGKRLIQINDACPKKKKMEKKQVCWFSIAYVAFTIICKQANVDP